MTDPRAKLGVDATRSFAVLSPPETPAGHEPSAVDPADSSPCRRRFVLVPDRSVILVEVRSSVGPISFGAIGVTGSVEATVVDAAISGDTHLSHTLRELAEMLDRRAAAGIAEIEEQDLVAHIRTLVGSD
jgi:hypothetical protein